MICRFVPVFFVLFWKIAVCVVYHGVLGTLRRRAMSRWDGQLVCLPGCLFWVAGWRRFSPHFSLPHFHSLSQVGRYVDLGGFSAHTSWAGLGDRMGDGYGMYWRSIGTPRINPSAVPVVIGACETRGLDLLCRVCWAGLEVVM